MKYLFFLSFFILGCYAKNDIANKEVQFGKVIKIVDGDTYDILLENQTTKRIRMEGIDAPERGMLFYKVSKDYLGQLCFGKSIKIVQTNTDRYGRTVAKSYIDDNELGLLMIQAGYAWHFKKYSIDRELTDAEIVARDQRIGLWADVLPVAPWEWRKRSKN